MISFFSPRKFLLSSQYLVFNHLEPIGLNLFFLKKRFRRKKRSFSANFMDGLLKLVPGLNEKCVHIKNWNYVETKVKALVDGNGEKLQVVADFDFTLTKFHVDGVRSPSCHGVIENYSRMPEMFKQRSKELFEKYYPIEIDPHKSVEEKIPFMLEWYDGAHKLMQDSNLYKEDFELMVKERHLEFRDGTLEFMQELSNAKVPILVFSAGVGDVIDEALKIHDLMKDNVKVISNYMKFDTNNKLVEFTGELIHMFNKNESAVPHSAAYFQDLAHRHNVILMGDSLGDLQMSKGVEPPSTVLTIGFLNDKIQERLQKYMDEFDIVLVDDQTMNIPRAILKSVLAQ